MHWDGYTVFSILSGLVLLLLAVVGQLSTKDRLWALAGAVFFCGYGIYVGNQTSGTFFFPIWIFVIPFFGGGYLLLSAAVKRSQRVNEPVQTPGATNGTGPGSHDVE